MSSAREARARRAEAVGATVVYADLFDFALDDAEVHRNLIGEPTSGAETAEAIAAALERALVTRTDGYLTLPGRGYLSAVRRRRAQTAADLWPLARRFGGLLAALPFVRMVGVTGSLAAGNPDDRADLDYLIVSQPGRLWLVRAGAILIVRAAAAVGARLCPNYIVSTRALALAHHDLYTAHELLQLVPLAGPTVYRRLRALNTWADQMLPNRSRGDALPPPASFAVRLGRGVGERLLGGKLGDYLDGWEYRRKAPRLAEAGSAEFSPDVCEGHYGAHRERVLARFVERCRASGIVPPATVLSCSTEPGLPSGITPVGVAVDWPPGGARA